MASGTRGGIEKEALEPAERHLEGESGEQQQRWPGHEARLAPATDHPLSVADRGIRVDCVAAGPVWTPLIPATLDPDHVARFGKDTLWGRAAHPVELAPTYVLLASGDGRYYTGEVLAPTGRAASR